MKTIHIKMLLLFALCLCFVGTSVAKAARVNTNGAKIKIVNVERWEVEITLKTKPQKFYASSKKIFEALQKLAVSKKDCVINYTIKDGKRTIDGVAF